MFVSSVEGGTFYDDRILGYEFHRLNNLFFLTFFTLSLFSLTYNR